MVVRFIHAADIHLDSPLSGLSSFPDAPIDSLRLATRRAFEGLIDQALAERVDFVVIAGDLFDGTWKDYNTGLYFVAQMVRLHQAQIRVVLLYGNHDAESEISRATRMRFPKNVFVFDSQKSHTIRFEDLRVALHGQSFSQRDVSNNLAKDYPPPVAGFFNIGVLHTALSGREGHAHYAPCSLDELGAKGYQYWALGHVHEPEILSRSPYVAFAGSLQGRHIREPGPHGAFLVQVDDDRLELTRLCSDVLRWATLRIAVHDHGGVPELSEAVERALGHALDQAEGRPLAVRIVLEGKTPLHGELFAIQSELREAFQAIALGFGPERAWVEKVRLMTSPLPVGDDSATTSDVASDLKELLVEAGRDPELVELLESEFGDLRTKLPFALREAPEPLLSHLLNARFAELVETVTPSLLSQLDRS